MREMKIRISIPAIGFLVLMAAGVGRADDVDSIRKSTGGTEGRPHFLFEIKREATHRGTPDETTKTQVKIGALFDGNVSLLRLEVPFPDEPPGFEGKPFNPHLGDIKVRVGFRPVPLEGIPFGPSLEVTFPTANPEDLGKGKYQISPGIRTNVWGGCRRSEKCYGHSGSYKVEGKEVKESLALLMLLLLGEACSHPHARTYIAEPFI